MTKTSFPIIGMHCASCARLIEKQLKKTPGVTDASVNYGSEQASVEHDNSVTPTVLSQAVSNIGYKAVFVETSGPASDLSAQAGTPTADEVKEQEKKKELKRLTRKVIVSAILTFVIILITLPEMIPANGLKGILSAIFIVPTLI